MKYSIFILEDAERDILEIYRYIMINESKNCSLIICVQNKLKPDQ
jgi:hypothetical protein